MSTFEARTHFGDWKGTAAADESDHHIGHQIREFLKEKKLLTDEEFLVSVNFLASEGYYELRAHILPGVTGLEDAQKVIKHTEGPLQVREVSCNLEPLEFVKMFKQFNVVLVWRETGQSRREYEVIQP
jgi:hypothetical protein